MSTEQFLLSTVEIFFWENVAQFRLRKTAPYTYAEINRATVLSSYCGHHQVKLPLIKTSDNCTGITSSSI